MENHDYRKAVAKNLAYEIGNAMYCFNEITDEDEFNTVDSEYYHGAIDYLLKAVHILYPEAHPYALDEMVWELRKERTPGKNSGEPYENAILEYLARF